MSNVLDTDQDRCSVGPDLGPKCLHSLSADHLTRNKLTAYLIWASTYNNSSYSIYIK